MRPTNEMMKVILDVAKADERIRVVGMNGSRPILGYLRILFKIMILSMS